MADRQDDSTDLIRRLDENERARLFSTDAAFERIRAAIGAAETDSPSEIADAVERLAGQSAAAEAGPAEMAQALRRIADAVGMGTGIHLCEDVPGAVELLVATHAAMRRELEARRPRDEAEAMMDAPTKAPSAADAALERIRLTVGADPEADASEIADAVWREDRDQERRRMWIHVAEKVVGSTPVNGHRDGNGSGKSAVQDADQVLAGFDAAFPGKS